jgi:hypothetical protein
MGPRAIGTVGTFPISGPVCWGNAIDEEPHVEDIQ